MLWTIIALLSGFSLVVLQLQLARERRWDLSHWLSGSLTLWFSNALFAAVAFSSWDLWGFATAKTALVGSAFLNVIILALAVWARRLAHDEPTGAYERRQIAHAAVAGVSFVGGLLTIAFIWTVGS